MSTLRILGLWLPVGVFMILLYSLSARAALPLAVYVWDKAAHATAYAILGALCLRAFHGGLDWIGLRPTLFGVALTLTYALLDELHQARVPGRVASVADWAADALGALAAVGLLGGMVLLRGAKAGRGSLRPKG